MKIRIFDPTGIKAEDYRFKYPELDRTPEFSELSPRALIFVWWYANPTSDLVLNIHDPYERAEEALKKAQFNPSKAEKDKILKLQFDSNMAVAVKRMEAFDPGARFKSYMMVRNIFVHYNDIIQRGPEAYQIVEIKKGKDGEETGNVTYTDYKRYVDVSAKIAEELPGLLKKIEEGFGVLNLAGDEIGTEGEVSDMRDWYREKDEN